MSEAIEDLRIAAQIMRGQKVAPSLRCIVIPATHEVFKQAMKEGKSNVEGWIQPTTDMPEDPVTGFLEEGGFVDGV